ncbi:MAG: flavodoxin family protein [Oscillospiraceae bacterium]|nr:flavodoxin family protein [Oscillospiraceae bacterium]
MKVLLVNGSPRAEGCTYTALSEVAAALRAEGASAEIFHIGGKPIQGCTGCGSCHKTGKCVFGGDAVEAALEAARGCDGFVFGSPVYYAAASGQLTAFMNRLFFSSGGLFAHKPGAAVVSCRRAGSTAALDQLNKYMLISQMLLVGSQYWPMVHGNSPDEVRRDLEGMQTMRVLGRNMAWAIKSIQAAGIAPPAPEPRERTNFIR